MAPRAYGPYGEAVEELANRLRLIQMDLADEEPSVREDYLAAEMDRALDGMVPDDRAPFLRELQQRFPDASGVGGGPDPDAVMPRGPTTVVTSVEPPVPTVEEALDSFLVQFDTVPDEDKERLLMKLWRSEPGEILHESFREDSSVTRTDAVSAMRTIEQAPDTGMLTMMGEFLMSLEKFISNTLKQIAPGCSSLPQGGHLGRALKACESGDAENLAALKKQLQALRSHTAAIVAAVPQAGRLFAKHHVAEFCPEAVQELVRMEGKSFMTSWEVAYWTKYCELAERRLHEDAIEKSILDNIGNYVERLLRTRV